MLELVSANHYRLHGEIDMQGSSALLRELLALPHSSGSDNLCLDLGALQATDSLLLAALLDLQRQLQQRKKRLIVSGMKEGMLGLARVYGIETLLDNMMEIK